MVFLSRWEVEMRKLTSGHTTRPTVKDDGCPSCPTLLDGHQPNSRGLYPLEGFSIKGGMTTPNENELIYPGTYLETSSWTCLGARPMAILMVLERNSWLKVSGSDESCQISPKLTSISRIATLEKKYTFARPWPSFLHIQSEFLQLSTLIYIDNFYINFDKPTIIGWLFGGRW